jgi:hypothetical protein
MSYDDYMCALSGLIPNEIDAGDDEGDDLGDLPTGWLKITVSRRTLNPKWVLVQQVKKAAIEQMLASIEGKREDYIDAIEVQIEAQFAAYEDKIGKYILDEDTAYVADPSEHKDISKEMIPILSALEFELDDFGIDDSEDEEPEDEEPEEVEETKQEAQ